MPAVVRRPTVTALVGALCIAFSAILVRLADVAPATAATFRCLYALPVLGLLTRWEQRRYGPLGRRAHRLALLAGVFFAADLVLWHQAIADVGAGLSTVLANLQVVVVGVIAWLAFDERPSPRVLLGVPVVLGGVVLISGAIGGDAYGSHPARGVVLGLLTGVTYAGFLIALRAGGRDVRRPAGPLFAATWVGAVSAALLGLALRDIDLVPSWPAHGWLALLALSSQVVAWLLIGISLPRLQAVVASILLTVQPVGTVALGIVLLDESPSPVQLLGVVVVLGGVTLASTRRTPTPVVAAGTAP